MKVVDLFCGCGGFSLGFDYLGDTFEVIYALDKWNVACESYEANFPNVDIDCRDASTIKVQEIPKADIIIGGPPCQDFSSAKMGTRKPEFRLIDWFLSVVDYCKPHFWIMENVPQVKKYLSRNIYYKIYRMVDYGVPQLRRRLFAGHYIEPRTEPTRLAFPTVLALESRWKSSFYIDELCPRKNPRKRGLGASSAFRRLCLVPEAKIIQTFPLDFELCGTLKDRYTQIGNAVSPLFAYKLAEAIKCGI